MNFTTIKPMKKLYILREAVDIAMNGNKLSQDYVDFLDDLFDDLSHLICDYDAICDDISAISKDIASEGDLDEIEFDLSSKTPQQKKAIEQFGDLYYDLLDGLDKSNEAHKTDFSLYLVPDVRDKNRIKLRIWDNKEMTWVRTYEDAVELEMNMEEDLKRSFNRQKLTIDLPKVKPLGKCGSKEYLEAEFGPLADKVEKTKKTKSKKKKGEDSSNER